MLDEDLAEEDEVGFNGKHTLKSYEEEDQPGFSGSAIHDHAKSDEIFEFVGDRVPESD